MGWIQDMDPHLAPDQTINQISGQVCRFFFLLCAAGTSGGANGTDVAKRKSALSIRPVIWYISAVRHFRVPARTQAVTGQTVSRRLDWTL